MDARYAALVLLDRARIHVERFLTAGIDGSARAAIGGHPRGRGILGLIVLENRPLRSDDVQQDPRGYGFPRAHPVMHSFLGVPLPIEGRPSGSLYLTDKRTGPFNDADEHATAAIAYAAATLIETFRSRQLRSSSRAKEPIKKPSVSAPSNATDRRSYSRCPRCGLTIANRAQWLTVEHCPRCLVRARALIQLHTVETPTRRAAT